MSMRLVCAASLMLASSLPAIAGDPVPQGPDPVLVTPVAPAPEPALVITLGLGIQAAPAYFGSDEYEISPSGSFAFHSINIGSLRFGDPDPTVDRLGFGLRGSFRFVAERDVSEHAELAGLDDVDATVELGLGVGYTARNYSAFLDMRRGFGGHEAWVAEAGADVIARPASGLTLTFGPRLFWGDNDYADTYFGVTPAQAGPTLAAFDPDGGLLSAGIEFGADYRLNDNWGIEGAISYDRFMNDAEDSPIVQQGSEDQWSIKFGFTRVIRIGG